MVVTAASATMLGRSGWRLGTLVQPLCPVGSRHAYATAAATKAPPPPRLRVRLGIACRGKAKEMDNRPGSQKRSMVTKNCDCGEDAYFKMEDGNRCAFGVADGVGGWQEIGVDSSDFSWDLMNKCADASRSLDQNSGIDDLVDETKRITKSDVAHIILARAFRRLEEEGLVKAGSSTACVLSLEKRSSILHVANLGDSGVMVIRDGAIAQRSTEQQHFFNAPYQLSVIPKYMKQKGKLRDVPGQAQDVSMAVMNKDIIVVGTDGLFDNMHDSEILSFVQGHVEEDSSVSDIAKGLMNVSHHLMQDTRRMSPFAMSANRNGYHVQGGKVDDVTVIVAKVIASDISSST